MSYQKIWPLLMADLLQAASFAVPLQDTRLDGTRLVTVAVLDRVTSVITQLGWTMARCPSNTSS